MDIDLIATDDLILELSKRHDGLLVVISKVLNANQEEHAVFAHGGWLDGRWGSEDILDCLEEDDEP